MKIKQIRNATNRIEYAGTTFLVDPWLAPKGAMGSFADIPGVPFKTPDAAKLGIPMPMCGLPEPVETILAGVDAYIVTHLHPDHIDMAMDGTVGGPLDKSTPVIVQSEADAVVLRKSGFAKVLVLSEDGAFTFGAVRLHKAPARHGFVTPLGDAMGVVFQADGEPTLYIAGDTVWYPAVQETLLKYRPEVVTVNACAAELVGNGRLIMNDEDVAAVAATLPDARIFITHMDTVSHATLTRQEMRGHLARRSVSNWVMPEDGESVAFPAS